jgi:hypothetical protein
VAVEQEEDQVHFLQQPLEQPILVEAVVDQDSILIQAVLAALVL